MATLLGLNAKLYRLSTGTRAAWPGSGAPSNLDLVDNIKDLTLSLSQAEADVTTRADGGYRVTVGTLTDAELSFEMIADPASADFTAFKNAFLNRTTLALAVLDGLSATTGTQGLWADFRVTGFTRTEPLEDAIKHTVTLKPGPSSVPPEWAVVA